MVIVKAYAITGTLLGPPGQFAYDRSVWQHSKAAEQIVFVRHGQVLQHPKAVPARWQYGPVQLLIGPVFDRYFV
jgi:hypothetical protein